MPGNVASAQEVELVHSRDGTRVAYRRVGAGPPVVVLHGLPTLLIVGASSPQRQQSNCEALAAALPDVRMARLEGLGHVAHSADPGEIVGAFLSPACA